MMGEVIRVSGRAPDVGDLLREAMVSQRFADVALCCSGGQRFLAHRLVLSAASPYLQEVLLAHGKAAGYCEPITVILAEVEGPELAAILGFVYTGSATVPRSRLEAFTRAAETLHVRIPPLTLSSSFRHHHHHLRRDLQDCKLDNVKIEETKLDSRYLGCEQYPSHDKWYNSTSCWPFDGCLERLHPRDEWKPTHQPLISQMMHRPLNSSSDINFAAAHPLRQNFPAENCHSSDKITQPEAPAAPAASCLPMMDLRSADVYPSGDPLVTGSRSEDGSYELLHLRRCRRIISGGERPLTTLDPFRGSDDSVSRMSGWESTAAASSRRDEAAMRLQQGEAMRYNDFEAAAESRSNATPSLPVQRNEATGRSSVTFEKQDYDGVEAVGSSAPAATVTSSIVAGNAAAAPRACGESCCRWRTPRRHVANRVPASPWSQLARPAHNSPKIRPIVLRNRDDSDEAARLRWNDAASTNDTQRVNKRLSPFLSTTTTTTFGDHENSSSAPLDLHHARPSSGIDSSAPLGSLYGFQVPKATEVAVDVRFVDGNRTSPDFYGSVGHQRPSGFPVATIPPTMDAFPSVIGAKEVSRSSDRSEPISGLFEDPTSRLRPPVQKSVAGIEEARGVIGQHAISPTANQRTVNDPSACNRRTSPRVELSHPISRLCDSIRLNGEIADRGTDRSPAAAAPVAVVDVAVAASAKETKINVDEEAQIFAGKPMFPPAGGIIQSDSNNNEASVDGSIHSRNLPPPSGDNTEAATGVDGVGVGAEDHRCEQCGKTFVTRASLKVHGRTHSGEKPFRCADCGKEFSQLRNYKYHRSVHEGTREFAATCPECGKYFNDRGYLSSHMKIHRNRKEYACAECGKSFNQRVAYNMHVRIHTGVKPHQCEQCGKAFSRKMLLKQHLRTHSGERPYQCQICHKAFADRSNMTLHTRLHSGLKPYQCTLCSKAFTKKHHLKTHLNYHTGTKPYSCPNCSLRFSQSSNMRTHYKKCSASGVVNGAVVNATKMITGPDDNGTATATNVPPVTSDKVKAKVTSSTTPVARTTSALTPPSSDHESSILHDSSVLHESRFTEKRCKPGRPYPGLRSKDAGASAPDT